MTAHALAFASSTVQDFQIIDVELIAIFSRNRAARVRRARQREEPPSSFPHPTHCVTKPAPPCNECGGPVSHRAGRKCSNYLFSLQLDHPTLKRNDIVVMVNHKVSGVKEGTEAAGATVQYLPQYSPDLTPPRCRSAKSKHFCERSLSGLVVVCAGGLAHSCQPSVARSVATTSDMPAMRPYDRNLL
jgi:hypothetical protein